MHKVGGGDGGNFTNSFNFAEGGGLGSQWGNYDCHTK